MLAARCPQCGAPTPVSAANPDHLDCAYCSYVGPPPPDVAASLRAAGAVLGRLEARRRQLSTFQQRTLNRMGCSMVLYFALLATVALPFALSAATCTAVRDAMPISILIVMGFGPLLVVLASGAFGWWWMRRSRAALELACAAQPPAAQGRPARCRVCGGDLWSRPGSAVARCGFCGADNVVSQAAMQRSWSEQQVVLGGYEQAVRARAEAAGSTSLYAKLLVLGAALGAPIIAGLGTLVVAFVLVLRETPPDTSQQYVPVATPKGKCLAQVSHFPGGVQAYDFDGQGPPGVKDQARFAAGTFKPIGVKDLVGLTVIDDDGQPGRIRRVYRTELDAKRNYVELDAPKGDYKPTQQVVGSCLAGDKPPRRVLTYTDFTHPLLVAPTGHAIALGFVDAVFLANGSDPLRQIWKMESHNAVAMRADDDAIYVELDPEVLRVTPAGKVETLAKIRTYTSTGFALDSHMLYFADINGVERVACAGGKVQLVISGVVARTLAVSGGTIAWIDADGKVEVRDLDADKGVELGHDAVAKHGVAIADSKVWWVARDGTLESAPVTGGAPEQHGKLDGIVKEFAIHGDQIWWARGRGGSVKHSALLSRELAGGALTNHAPNARTVDAFCIDGSDLYWVDESQRYLMQRAL